ncbi:MAG TPA: TonB-dependent receptor [Steroidobacteraceae bacterium]|nr:TonB-dependent receptor [Steroidobacteraceae bacterium]
MSHDFRIRRAVRRALLASLTTLGAIPAMAQEAAPVDTGEVVTVTGSRIQRHDYEAESPLATVTADAIQATGRLNTEGVLNTLPQVVPGFTAFSNNPGDGTATVDLRGLGPTRTLVLVNGRRLNPSVNNGTVDLNNVPTRLIKRIEVVTGGASAVYGSDALAGVVNFILQDDFQGVDLSTQLSQSARNDGRERQIDLLAGGNFADDRGNLTAYASWYDREQVLQSARDYTRVNFATNPAARGSATGAAGRFDVQPNDFFTDANGDPIGSRVVNPDGSVRPFVGLIPEANDGLAPPGVGDRYNFNPVNNLLTPAERVSIGALGHFDVSDSVRAYTELLYVDSKNSHQLAETPATGLHVLPSSPLLSQDVRDLLASRINADTGLPSDPNLPAIFRRRMTEMGPRIQDFDSKLQQITLGTRGDLPLEGWKFDAYYEYGRTEFNSLTRNDVSRSRLEAAINGCPEEFTRFVPGCVPADIFGANRMSQAAADFVRLNFSDQLVFERQLVDASVNGNLFALPAGRVGFAAGVEWRQDQSAYTPDQAKDRGDILGFNAAHPIAGEFNVKEVFVEGLVPILADKTFAKKLDLSLGARASDYSTVGSVSSYKAGLTWAPVDALSFRTMFQAATRAPSVFELFQAGDQNFPLYSDPCAGATDPQTVAFCRAQGVPHPDTYQQPNVQIEAFNFGNPHLKQESSDTITAGFVVRPQSIETLQLSLDYWHIKVDDYINSLAGGVQGIINNCFASNDLNSPACFSDLLQQPLIFRDETGELKARVPLVNTSKLTTSGIDLQLDYGIPFAFARGHERLNVNLLVSYLKSYVLDGIDYAGTSGAYNITGSWPRFKANARLSYGWGPVDVTWNIQYIDAMLNQGLIPAFQDPGPYVSPGTRVYHDLSARWRATNAIEVALGVRNLTDRKPPQMDNAIDQNSDPSTYDVLGRAYFGSFSVKF